MSDLLQTGQHPDADQLTAFVEHALPTHEQEQTLAHLAICPACRQIVALSLPPAAESAAPHPEPALKHRFFRWYLAWAGIPAIAALVLSIIFIRNSTITLTHHQISEPPQMATARRPTSLAPSPSAASNIPGKQKAQPAFTDRNARHQALQQSPHGTTVGAIGGVLGGSASQHPQPQGRISAAISAPESQPVPVPLANTVSNAATVSVGGPVAKAPQPASVADALTINGRALDRAQNAFFTQSPLPSHLAVMSMATNAHQRLAIDTQNQVFFSVDDGRHWKALSSPWKGRAVTVALASPASYGNGAPALTVSSSPTTVTGSALSGTVKDASGAIIRGATVTALNANAALVRSVQTDSHGQFRLDNIAPGSYRLETQASGFQKQSSPIELAASQQTSADVTLQVGSASETVQVQASPSPIATESPTVTQSIDAKKTSEPAASSALSHFEITTDTGDRWTSTDGQTWKHE